MCLLSSLKPPTIKGESVDFICGLVEREHSMLEPPYVYVFNRVKDEMQRIALEWLPLGRAPTR